MPDSASRPDPSEVNRAFYSEPGPGKRDYWRYMAAPRARVDMALALLSEEPPARVVDLGCGGGELLGEISRRFPDARLAGVDLSPGQIAANRERHPEIDWEVVDLESSRPLDPALAGRFDAVVALEVIEHLADPVRFLEQAFALARPGGRIVLSTQSGPVRETERLVGHRRHFTAVEIRSRLEAAGWIDTRAWNAGYPFHDLSKWWANRAPAETMARFGERAWGARERAIAAVLRALFRLNSSRSGAQLFAVARRPA